MKRWLNFHTHWGMFPIISRHKRCATRLYTTTQQFFFFVPDCFKTQELCIKALAIDPWQLNDIPDYLKKQKMCDKAVKNDPSSLRFVSDWFVTQQQVDVWYDDDYWYHDDEIIGWYNGYQKRKTQKAKIKEELLPVAWDPLRVMNCMLEDEKRQWQCF